MDCQAQIISSLDHHTAPEYGLRKKDNLRLVFTFNFLITYPGYPCPRRGRGGDPTYPWQQDPLARGHSMNIFNRPSNLPGTKKESLNIVTLLHLLIRLVCKLVTTFYVVRLWLTLANIIEVSEVRFLH